MATQSDYYPLAQQLYTAYLQRPGDYKGMAEVTRYLASVNAPTTLQGLVNDYDNGKNTGLQNLVTSFAGSAEWKYGHLRSASDAAIVTQAYQELLGRDPLIGGLDFWATALATHAVDRSTLAVHMMAAVLKDGGNAADQAVLETRLHFANAFTASINTPERIEKYSGPGAVSWGHWTEILLPANATPQYIDAKVASFWGGPDPDPVIILHSVPSEPVVEVIGIPPQTG